MSKSKTPKKSDATAEKTGNGSVAIADRPSVMDPLRRVDSWFDQWPSLFARRFPDLLAHPMATMEPMRVEEFVDGDECVIRLEAPGVDIDSDVDITVENDRLTVSAKRERREESSDDDGFRSEFQYGTFRRTMTLPVGTDADDIAATYEDGIVEIRVPPRREQDDRRHIAISKR